MKHEGFRSLSESPKQTCKVFFVSEKHGHLFIVLLRINYLSFFHFISSFVVRCVCLNVCSFIYVYMQCVCVCSVCCVHSENDCVSVFALFFSCRLMMREWEWNNSVFHEFFICYNERDNQLTVCFICLCMLCKS